ncbi:hypothetical protein EAG_08119 [Camponotus floridanus]|uniref:Uncharacterized protein n=1 Tax=Camponotus floridanus TaxID=104421 RepID=E2AEY9_CAMFO|nr:hypothetical protein EAG_08119 [Camponotus floridanus]
MGGYLEGKWRRTDKGKEVGLPPTLLFRTQINLCFFADTVLEASPPHRSVPAREDATKSGQMISTIHERHSNRASGSTLHFRQTATTASNAGGWFRALRPEVSRELGNVVGTG